MDTMTAGTAAKILLWGSMTLAVTACGSGGSPGTAHNAQVISNAQQASLSEQSIKQAFMGLPSARLDDEGDVEYLAPGEDPGDLSVGAGCTLDVILTSAEDVATYQGDTWVVLNPSGTAGAKIVGSDQAEAGCLREVAADV